MAPCWPRRLSHTVSTDPTDTSGLEVDQDESVERKWFLRSFLNDIEWIKVCHGPCTTWDVTKVDSASQDLEQQEEYKRRIKVMTEEKKARHTMDEEAASDRKSSQKPS